MSVFPEPVGDSKQHYAAFECDLALMLRIRGVVIRHALDGGDQATHRLLLESRKRQSVGFSRRGQSHC